MFDFVRRHTRIMMGVLFLLVIPSFVLFGVDGYNQSNSQGETVARVGSHDISQAEWDAAHRIEADRLRTSMPTLDVKLLDSPEARYATLERLVRDRVLLQATDKFKLSTSDAMLARNLQEDPTIASLRLPDGKLDMDRYRQLAASQGLTPEGFEARVRKDLSVRQIEAAVTATSFATPGMADVALNSFFEKREAQILSFVTDKFLGQVTPTDTELENYYKANQAMFQSPEQASIEYVVLDLNAVTKTISINESDLKSYYEQNVSRLSGNEQRRASHILINAAKDAPVADKQKAKARADELLKQLRQAPGNFAEVAKKNSQDTGSAANGGDLDFFGRGSMVKPFEEAVFAMKKGEISEVVESDFGYHIIQLTDVKAPKQLSFEELRVSLEADLKKQQAQRQFAEAAEAFTNGVYEQSDSLKPIADKLKLEVNSASNVLRRPPPGVTGVLANDKFLTAIFAPDAVEKNRNTEAIETAPSQLVAGRIKQYTPARTQPFEAVREAIRNRVMSENAALLAKKEGREKLALWKASPDTAVLPAAIVLSRDQPLNTAASVLNAVLRADASVLPALIGVDLGPQGYALARVNKVISRAAPTEAIANQGRVQYGQWWASAENQAYYDSLKDRFKVKMMVSRPVPNLADSVTNVAK
ncbi:MAG: SurA N-terminal domain-containing protein [Rhodoferax sp.]|nr:SurA N-terminal domain-containing protein [Rhodoferax sp.]